jgi:hypothetical protein
MDAQHNSLRYIPATPANAVFGYGVLGKLKPTISGDNSFCLTSDPYTLLNLLAGSSVTWSISPSGYASVNTPTAASTALTQVTSGLPILSASITNSCGTGTSGYVTSKNIAVGIPQTAYLGSYTVSTNPTNNINIDFAGLNNKTLMVQSNKTYTLDMNLEYSGSTTYAYTILGGYGYSGVSYPGLGYVTFTLTGTNAPTIALKCVATNSLCGTISKTITFVGSINTFAFAVSPNPSTSSISISQADVKGEQALLSNEKNISTGQDIQEVKIMTKMGSLVKDIKYPINTKSVNLSVSDLLPDDYILQIYNGTTWEPHLIQKK